MSGLAFWTNSKKPLFITARMPFTFQEISLRFFFAAIDPFPSLLKTIRNLKAVPADVFHRQLEVLTEPGGPSECLDFFEQ